MQALVSTARFATEGLMNTVFKWVQSFFRRRLIGVWMMGLEVPKPHGGFLRDDSGLFLRNSACCELESFFFDTKPLLGATVFWAPERAGKTYILSRLGLENSVDRRFVYVDFYAGGDAKKFFYGQLGLDADCDIKPLSHYLPSGVFFTFIFDHFDRTSFSIASLAEDSVRSLSFNLLILVNDSLNAHSLLTSCGQQLQREIIRLLGPPYCGRWFASDLGEFSDARYDDLVNQCGTLAPMISVRNGTCSPSDSLMLLRVAKLEAEWEQGERLLGRYRTLV